MKRFLVLLTVTSLAALTTGCGSATAPKSPAQADSHGHAHDEKSHAHGAHGHAAHGAGPHGGTLTDWGGGAYHVEFTVDHDKKEATVYIVGGDEKSPAPIMAKTIQLTIANPATELTLVAKPLDGEPDGASSRFVGTHDTLGIVKEFSGTISGQIEDTPFTGDFKEEAPAASSKT